MNPISRVVCSHGQHFGRTGRSASPLLSAVRGYGGVQFQMEKGARVIDMRSDVLTKPSAAVKDAMSQATADDDIFREDRTVLELESFMAKMFGKEAALFVPSGTMGNLIGVLAHCQTRGLEVILGDRSHMFMWEQGGLSQIGGLHPRTIPNKPDGTFDLDVLEDGIRPKDDPHQPWTGLIVVENTHNYCGGRAIPMDFMAELRKRANKYDIPIHVDGARILNAAVALNVTPRDIMEYADSVSFCFSKGVGAPIGSVLIGSHELIARALRLRKVLGGGWRKPGGLAAAALVAMQDAAHRLQKDHEHAKLFAKEISSHGLGVVSVDVDSVQTNMVMVKVLKKDLSAKAFCQRLSQVTKDEQAKLDATVQVRVNPARVPKHIRVCTMLNLTTSDIKMAVEKWKYVLEEFAD